LEKIDFSQINSNNERITKLDISKNFNLKVAHICCLEAIKEIDFNQNPLLRELKIYSCNELNKFDIS